MHELSITQSIVDTIAQRLGPAPVHRLTFHPVLPRPGEGYRPDRGAA